MHKTTAHTRLTQLIKRYKKGTATPREAAFVEQYYAYFDKRPALTDSMTDAALGSLRNKMLDQIHQRMVAPEPVHRVHLLRTSWFRYAAAVILLLVSAAVIWYIRANRSVKPAGSETVAQATDILPGTNKAILAIGNNQPINLSNHKTGISIASNAVTYNDGERIADAGQQLTLTTPRGGQYQAVLPDGTKVWLNAESSILFPSKFTGDRREVEVSGEVYIEVAKNTKQPFYVRTGKADIQVLGTSFNVNAYEDEQLEKTTLIEGSVRVGISDERSAVGRSRRYDQGVILKPGQQASLERSYSNDPEVIKVESVNTGQVLAWKNGVFDFNNVTVHQAMRQLARWYDVNIIYDKPVNEMFIGEVGKSLNLNQVLKVLDGLGVHFKLEGKDLHVFP